MSDQNITDDPGTTSDQIDPYAQLSGARTRSWRAYRKYLLRQDNIVEQAYYDVSVTPRRFPHVVDEQTMKSHISALRSGDKRSADYLVEFDRWNLEATAHGVAVLARQNDIIIDLLRQLMTHGVASLVKQNNTIIELLRRTVK